MKVTVCLAAMSNEPRVLLVGAGSPNADYVAHVLSLNGIRADWTDRVKIPNPFLIRRFDVIYGIYLQTCSRYVLAAKFLRKKAIVHFVGSDAYWIARERSFWRRSYWNFVLRLVDAILYVSPHLQSLVNRKGIVLPFPIASDDFARPRLREVAPDRDVIYYCPSGPINEKIYRLQWVIDYAKSHPDEKITIVGNPTHPASYDVDLPNVMVIPYVDYSQMPMLYRRHKRLIRMTTEDGLPRMVHEALLCGLQVTFNGREVREIPQERHQTTFAAAFRKVLNDLLEKH